MDSQPPKSIIESTLFEASKKKIQKDARRFDDAIGGVTFTIALKPDDFPIDSETGIRTVHTHATEDTPALTIYFREIDETIILLDVEISKDGDLVE